MIYYQQKTTKDGCVYPVFYTVVNGTRIYLRVDCIDYKYREFYTAQLVDEINRKEAENT